MDSKVLSLFLGVFCSFSPGKAVDLNVIYVGSSVENDGEGSSSDSVWPAVQFAVERVNMLEGMLEGYNLTVTGGKLQVNSSLMETTVSETCLCWVW